MKYQIDGNKDKPWLIFSNSLGTSLTMWDGQVEELKNNFHILRYETDGQQAKDISDLGKNVLRLMDELKIQQAHFCGISLGGLIGQWLGIHHSDRFLSLTLANTSPKISSEEVWEKRIQLVKEKGLAPVAEASPGRWFTAAFREKEPAKVSKALEGFSRTDPKDYISCCEILKKTDLWSELSKIKCKTFVIAGEFDEVTTVAEAQRMVDLIPSSHLEILPTAHLSSVESSHFLALLLKVIKHI